MSANYEFDGDKIEWIEFDDSSQSYPCKYWMSILGADAETGRIPTTRQAILRNLPYILGWLVAAIPGFEVVGWAFLAMAGALDLGMVLADPLGRRLGDRIAGTKVVPGHPEG